PYYWGHIWKDGQFYGVCGIGSEYQDKAREAAIDWAWQASGQTRPDEKTAQQMQNEPVDAVIENQDEHKTAGLESDELSILSRVARITSSPSLLRFEPG